MKFNYWIANAILSFGLLANSANAQYQANYFDGQNQTQKLLAQLQPSLPLSNQERQELSRLRQEKEIRDRVQAEVDRAFGRITYFLYILLLVTILFPVLTGLGFWLFYRNLINQIASENRNQFKKEIQNQLENELAKESYEQTSLFKQEIIKLKFEFDEKLNQIIQQANYGQTYQHNENNLIEHTEQTSWSEIPVENQQLATAASISSLSDSQVETPGGIENQIREIVTMEEASQPPTEEEELEPINDTQSLTAEEYFNLGNNHLAEGNYVEANQCYNDAVKIERNFPEARYQNARAYALRGNINPAIGNLQWAIDLDPKYKEIAKADSAFAYIRTDEQFKQVMDE